MSEIPRNTSQFVYLDILGGTADELPTAVVDSTPLTVNGPETVGDYERWTAVVGLAQTQEVGEVKVEWNFSINGTEATKIDYLDVIVPLAPYSTIREELDLGSDVTDDDISMAERRVRKIVENYCGQQFAPVNETILVRAKGTNRLVVPKRLISVEDVTDTRTGFVLTSGYELRNDGWELTRTFNYLYDTDLTVLGPIYDPWRYGTLNWSEGSFWNVKGRWGWERVPSHVQEAALILMEQRLCPQAAYRDNYLQSVTAADWRMQYSPQAYSGTGNVVADQILSPYMVLKAAVI